LNGRLLGRKAPVTADPFNDSSAVRLGLLKDGVAADEVRGDHAAVLAGGESVGSPRLRAGAEGDA
jgi:hypothetical protein